MEQLKIESNTGALLNVFWHAPDHPRAVVQINHGLAEHGGCYQEFMADMAEAGIATVAHDHRGHGLTSAADSKLGVFAEGSGVGKVIEDTAFVQDWCAQQWPDLPLIAFGHSMGGMIALNTAVTYPDRVRALSIWNSSLAPGLLGTVAGALISLEAALSSQHAPGRIPYALTFAKWDKTFSNEGGEFNWLSQNEAFKEAYRQDPLCGFRPSNSMWADVIKMARAGEDDQALALLPPRLPLYLVAGDEDPATNGGKDLQKFKLRLNQLGRNNIDLKIYPKTRHDTLSEAVRDQAVASFISWIFGTVLTAGTQDYFADEANYA